MSTLFRVIIEGVDELTGETISRDIAKEYKIKKTEHIDGKHLTN